MTFGNSWSRRHALAALASTTLPQAAFSGTSRIEHSVANLGGQPVQITKYTAAGRHKRPAVLLLHGTRGLAARSAAYDRYGRDIAAAGMDAWVFSYFESSEAAAILQAVSSLGREQLYAQFISSWVARIHRLAAQASQQSRCSGRVGILGFSLGGMVGVAAANGAAFSALAVFYASLPTFYRARLTFLPPLLDLHGDADSAVPLAMGSKLVAAARSLGGAADLQVYEGQGHAFDLDLTNPASEPARRRAIAFLARQLAHI